MIFAIFVSNLRRVTIVCRRVDGVQRVCTAADASRPSFAARRQRELARALPGAPVQPRWRASEAIATSRSDCNRFCKRIPGWAILEPREPNRAASLSLPCADGLVTSRNEFLQLVVALRRCAARVSAYTIVLTGLRAGDATTCFLP